MDFKVDGGGCDRRYSYEHSLPAAVGCGGGVDAEDFEVVVEREPQNTEIWFSSGGGVEAETPTDPINNNSPSLFHSSSLDFIPPLPDFPCMSSSSSSSTTPTPSKPVNAFISTSSATSSLSSSSSATSSSASSSAGSSLVVFRSDNEFDDHNNSQLDHVGNIDVSYHQQHHHRRSYDKQQQQQQLIKSGGDAVNLHNCWDEGQISHTHDFHYEQKVENNRNNNQLEAAREEGDQEMLMNIEDVVDCMNVMDDFDTMGLSLSQLMDETNEIWDPTPLFEDSQTPQPSNQTHGEEHHQQQLYQHPDQDHNYLHVDMNLHHHQNSTTTYHDDNNQPPPTVGDDNDEQHHPFLFLEDEDEDDDNDNEDQSTTPKRRFNQDNQVDGGPSGDDLAVVFFEWLKSNKELSISAEDLRSIKIKKSTIECAAKRLGGGKEGMKQLLKLVLQWVQNHHLQNKRLKSSSAAEVDELLNPPPLLSIPLNQQLVNNSINCPKPNNTNLMTQQHPTDLAPPPPNCFNQPPQTNSAWPVPQQPLPPPPPYASDHIPNMAPGFSSMVNYMNTPADPYSSHITNTQYSHPPLVDNSNVSSWPSQPPPSYPPMMPPPLPHYNPMVPDPANFSAYSAGASQYPPYQFFPGLSDGANLRLGFSATKEARKKRMARQRRVFTHHHNRSSSQHHHQNHQQNSQMMIHGGAGAGMMMSDGGNHNSSGTGPWAYWPPNSRAGGVVPTNGQMVNPPIAQMLQQQQQVPSQEMERPTLRGNGSNSTKQTPGPDKSKLQGSKTEKNLKFLLQKVLKQSDVGNLGRIVLPKKEAETHLPELDARDGIPIAMEDIGTSRVWNMRYRFWPNNKSRMYLLENTGDFVRSNGLQEGDFIVIYSDVKCGKYMIRGVKVRTPQGPKPDSNKKQLIKPQKIETAARLIC